MHKASRLNQERDIDIVREYGAGKPALEKQYQRAVSSGHWLLTTPNRLNGSQLSAEEFRDNLWLQENLKPLDMSQLCDGCWKRLTADHALLCKCGSLVHIRHDDVGKEWESLSVCAFSQGAVSHEPYIYGANRQSDHPTQSTHQHSNATAATSATTAATAATAATANARGAAHSQHRQETR